MDCPAENISHKKRGRKKLLYQSIRNQMEFYFSSANLAKDRWLSTKLNEEECIHLTEFLRFNKIKALTEDVNDLAKALKNSELLTVTEDLKVKRSQPIKFKENEDEYVIYVEQVPPEADHDWIRGIFSIYGNIDYVSLPKFKNSNKCKGFAFIEFTEIDSAQKAIKDFREKGNYLSTDIAPEELLSISKYEGNTNPQKKENTVPEVLAGNEAVEVSSDNLGSSTENLKKRKNSETNDSDVEQKRLKTDISSDDPSNGHENIINTPKEDVTDSEKNEVYSDEVKKKKQRKKKNKKKKKKEEVENISLQILAKKDWKRLRNKYLNMQKEKMKQLKKHLYTAQKKSEQNGIQRKLNEKPSKDSKDGKTVDDKKTYNSTFTPGLIVKVKFDEPVVDVKGLKNDMKKNTSIKYVDVKEGVQKIYLRFETPESASDFCENSTWPKTKILKGQKESDYWEKLLKQRADKFSQVTKKKERGKDKLMKKAENILGKHITFEE